MQVDELLRYVTWADTEVREKGLQSAYTQFVAVLQNNTAPNQQRQTFQSQKDNLQKLLDGVNFVSLNETQVAFGETIGMGPVVGEMGSETIAVILRDDAADPVAIHSKVAKMARTLEQALAKVAAIQAALGGVFPVPKTDYEEAMIHVRFKGDVAIKNVADLQLWSDHWYTIARGLNMALGGAPEEVRVVGASKGSLVVDLAASYGFVELLSKISHSLAAVAKDYYDLKTQAENLKRLKIETRRAELDAAILTTETTAEKVLEEGKDRVQQDLVTGMNLTGDVVVALGQAVKLLQDFRVGGGEIDPVVKDTPGDDVAGDPAKTKLLKEQIEAIRKIHAETRKIDRAVLRLKDKNE